MRKLSLDEVKKYELQVLVWIDEICRKQAIKYCMVGGTLIGAIRHKGFIPWDDDIDIAMPRPDYEKFIEYCMNHDIPFTFLTARKDKKLYHLNSKACYPGTKVIFADVEREDIGYGVMVDIFPLDALGNSVEEAERIFNAKDLYKRFINGARLKKICRSKTFPIWLEPIRYCAYCLTYIIDVAPMVKAVEKFYSSRDYGNAIYVGAISSQYVAKREVHRKEVFEELAEYEFERIKFYGPRKYDEYLSKVYGDYMKLPPVEERVPKHEFDAYIVE